MQQCIAKPGFCVAKPGFCVANCHAIPGKLCLVNNLLAVSESLTRHAFDFPLVFAVHFIFHTALFCFCLLSRAACYIRCTWCVVPSESHLSIPWCEVGLHPFKLKCLCIASQSCRNRGVQCLSAIVWHSSGKTGRDAFLNPGSL